MGSASGRRPRPRRARRAVGVGRRVDDDQLGPLLLRCGDLGGEPRGRAVDHFGRRIPAPGGPLAGGRLRVGVDDERDAPGLLGRGGKVDGERRLPGPAHLADDRDDWHEPVLYVDMATWQVVDMANLAQFLPVERDRTGTCLFLLGSM